MTDLSLVLRLMGQDVSMSRTIAGVGSTAKRTESDLTKLRGAALSALGGVTFIAAAGAAVKGAGAFQAQLTLLSTAAGESRANLGLVGDGIRKISDETGQSAHNLAEGMYLIEKAGYRGAAGLNVLHAAAEGAAAENVDMATMTGALTSIMTSYHVKASGAVQVTNELVAASGAAKTTMQDFAGSLSTVLPLASAAHISFAQVGGAVATLTQHGTSAQEATFELANSIRALQNPNHVAQAEMQQLGLDVNDVSTGLGKRGLTGTIELLYGAITSKMGPGGTLLLNSFKESKAASADLQVMLGKMPKSLAEVSKQFLNGEVSAKTYRTTVKGLGADGYEMGTQFLSLVGHAKGFNDLLRSGSPAAQTFVAALAKVMGGATGLNTALQLGGENMAGFKARVDEVSAASEKSGTDISTWAQTSKTFNVELAKAEQTVLNFAQTTATNLMPTITDVMHILDDTVGILGGLPHGFDSLALEVGVAAFAFPKLAGAVASTTTAVKDQITYARVLKLEMGDQATRGTALTTMFSRLGPAVRNVAGIGGMVALANGAQHANTTLGELEIVGGSVATGFATGGPWGAAIGGAASLLGLFMRASQHSGQSVAEFQTALAKTRTEQAQAEVNSLTTSLDNLSGAYTTASRAAVEHGLRDANGNLLPWVATLHKAGVSLSEITDGLMGNAKANRQVEAAFTSSSKAQLTDNATKLAGLQAQIAAAKRLMDAASAKGDDSLYRGRRTDYQNLKAQLQPQIDAIEKSNAAINGLRQNYEAMAGANVKAVAGAEQDAVAVNGIAKAFGLTKQQADRLNEQIKLNIKTNTPETTQSLMALGKQIGLNKQQLQQLAGAAPEVINVMNTAATIAAHDSSSIGTNWMDGITAGIVASQGTLNGAAMRAVNTASQAAKNHLQIQSPSKVTNREIGVPWAQGVALGITSQKSMTVHAAMSLMDSVMTSAKDRLKADLAAKASFADSFAQGFSSSVFGQQFTDASGNAVKPSVSMILNAAKTQAATANDVKWDTNRLVKLGLSPSLIKQMQSAGASGLAEMDELARYASKGQIASLNHYDTMAAGALAAAGRTAAGGAYDKQIAADRHTVALTNALTKLTQQLSHMGKDQTITVVVGGETIRAAIRKDQKAKGQKVTV